MRLTALIGLALFALGLATEARAAAPYTVGPGGTHATIQGAIDDAIRAGVARDIRVSVGRWPERLWIRTAASPIPSLRLLGGWTAGFATRVDDPSRTIVDAGGVGQPLQVESSTNARIGIGGFTFTGGFGASTGGLFLGLHGHTNLSMDDVRIVGTRTHGPLAQGGGLHAYVTDDARLWMSRLLVQGNTLESDEWAYGAGAMITASGSAYVEIRDSRFVENEGKVVADQVVAGSGLAVGVHDGAGVRLEGNRIEGNRVPSAMGGYALALRAYREPEGRIPLLIARRNLVVDNTGGSRPQVWIEAYSGCSVTFSDGIIARGTGQGLSTLAFGEVYATHLTITRNAGPSVFALGDGTTYLSNTILFDNGDDASGVVESHNLRDDPSFVDSAGDYHLRPGSPAIDTGTSAVPGGLGPQDIDRDPRTRGPHVDIGADEAPSPAGPFREPACSVLPFAGESSPVCRCVSEPDLRAARCGALVDRLFLSARIPLGLDPDKPIDVPWTILPIAPLAGAYSMSAEALVDGAWQAQEWLGPKAPSLKDGQTVVEPFRWKVSKVAATPVRTRLKYLPPGLDVPTTVTVEVTLPEPPPK